MEHGNRQGCVCHGDEGRGKGARAGEARAHWSSSEPLDGEEALVITLDGAAQQRQPIQGLADVSSNAGKNAAR